MPMTSKGRRIMRSMRKTYGSDKKAKQVFYASENAGKIKGVHKEAQKLKGRKKGKKTLKDAERSFARTYA